MPKEEIRILKWHIRNQMISDDSQELEGHFIKICNQNQNQNHS